MSLLLTLPWEKHASAHWSRTAGFQRSRRRRAPDQAVQKLMGRDEFAHVPLQRQQGIAFVALLERVLKSDLPRHGGKATSVGVLIDYNTLVADVTAAGIA